MIKLTTIAAAAALSLGVAGTANAIPMLNIVDSGGALQTAHQEAIGDPGGTLYTNGPTTGASAGPGMPTDLGGWPNNYPTPGNYPPGFDQDPSFNNNWGISGYDQSYLYLTEASDVTFQFMGRGDANNTDTFTIYDPNTNAVLFTWNNQSAGNGTCGVSGTSPNCPYSGSQVTLHLDAGLVPFEFLDVTTGDVATNFGPNQNNPQDTSAGYFLGMDPYLAMGQYENTGRSTYAGFTDLPCTTGAACDHDYEDLVVRISTVPEPSTVFLLGAGLLSFGVGRRKMAARSV